MATKTEDLEQTVKILLAKATFANTANEALHFSQAALNAAHAINSLPKNKT